MMTPDSRAALANIGAELLRLRPEFKAAIEADIATLHAALDQAETSGERIEEMRRVCAIQEDKFLKERARCEALMSALTGQRESFERTRPLCSGCVDKQTGRGCIACERDRAERALAEAKRIMQDWEPVLRELRAAKVAAEAEAARRPTALQLNAVEDERDTAEAEVARLRGELEVATRQVAALNEIEVRTNRIATKADGLVEALSAALHGEADWREKAAAALTDQP